MSKHSKHYPKHRAAPRARRVPRVVRGAVVMGGLAVATTGMSVSGGVLNAGAVSDGAADLVDAVSAAADTSELTAADLERRQESQVSRSELSRPELSRSERSRSDRRDAGGPKAAKAAALGTDSGLAMAATEKVSESDPREIGRALIAELGFSAEQFTCLDSLYVSESDWRVDADNPTSSAYGIPQALTSLHDLPADYMTSAEAQIRWGLEYIQRSYGTPCNAWSFKQGNGWY